MSQNDRLVLDVAKSSSLEGVEDIEVLLRRVGIPSIEHCKDGVTTQQHSGNTTLKELC